MRYRRRYKRPWNSRGGPVKPQRFDEDVEPLKDEAELGKEAENWEREIRDKYRSASCCEHCGCESDDCEEHEYTITETTPSERWGDERILNFQTRRSVTCSSCHSELSKSSNAEELESFLKDGSSRHKDENGDQIDYDELDETKPPEVLSFENPEEYEAWSRGNETLIDHSEGEVKIPPHADEYMESNREYEGSSMVGEESDSAESMDSDFRSSAEDRADSSAGDDSDLNADMGDSNDDSNFGGFDSDVAGDWSDGGIDFDSGGIDSGDLD